MLNEPVKFVAILALTSELPIEFWPFEEPIIYSVVGKLNAAFTTICNKSECKRWERGWLFSDADHLSSLGVNSISELPRGKD